VSGQKRQACNDRKGKYLFNAMHASPLAEFAQQRQRRYPAIEQSVCSRMFPPFNWFPTAIGSKPPVTFDIDMNILKVCSRHFSNTLALIANISF